MGGAGISDWHVLGLGGVGIPVGDPQWDLATNVGAGPGATCHYFEVFTVHPQVALPPANLKANVRGVVIQALSRNAGMFNDENA